MNEILNGCATGVPNSYKALAVFPLRWFSSLDSNAGSILKMMLNQLLIGISSTKYNI
jgi:hypothetical protein